MKATFVLLLIHIFLYENTFCLVFPGVNKAGSKCHYGKDGVLGRCEEALVCLRTGGLIKSDDNVRLCEKVNGKTHVCCRRPYRVARDICRAWRSYWRSNNGQCIEETPLIVGGEEAGVGQFPHIAIIGLRDRSGNTEWRCGGSLISPHFVLTAAHCVVDRGQYVVRLGEHDLFRPRLAKISRIVGAVPLGLYKSDTINFETRNQVATEQTVPISRVIVHPEYDGRYNDIALLELKKQVVITRRVMPACLPFDRNQDFSNMDVTAAGWGRISFHSKFSRTLQKVKFPTIDRLTCQERLQTLNPRLIPKGIIERQMCAGENGKDTCKGDSGGPLVLQLRNSDTPCEHTIAGIVAFGFGCGDFGVYTRVSSYIEWITRYIAPEAAPSNIL